MNEEEAENLTFASDEPDIPDLAKCYTSTLSDLHNYFSECRESYNHRHNIWPGKGPDLRKQEGQGPWKGASDTEANTVAERINTYVSLCLFALNRAHIQALPVAVDDIARAATVSKMVKYMRDTWIPGFTAHMETAANHLFEKALAVTFIGWQEEMRTRLQRIELAGLEKILPGITGMIQGGEDDAGIAQFLFDALLPDGTSKLFPGATLKRLKRAVRSLRNTGKAEFPVALKTVNRPVVQTLAPDAEVFWPAFVTDIQRSPVIFIREFLSPQEIRKRVTSGGWNEEWAENVIANYRGKDTWRQDGELGSGSVDIGLVPSDDAQVMVLTALQRLIDDEDGSEGIYRTVFHPDLTGDEEVQPWAMHELLDGLDDYPVVVTPLSRDQRRLHETESFGTLLRGTQWCVKTARDQRIDRASLAIAPTIMHPIGRPPSDWGAFRMVGVRRPGEITYGPTPPPDSGAQEVELTLTQAADRLVGLDYSLPNTPMRQQFFIDKFLCHARDVLKMSRKMCRRYGPPQIEVRISGDPNAEVYDNTLDDEEMDVSVTFDTQNTDPETIKRKIEFFVSMLPLDRYGVIDGAKLIYMLGASVDPGISAAVFQPVEAAQEKIIKAVTDDLAKLYSGVGVGAQPNGAQIALQVVAQWMQQPDIAERYQADDAFRERVDTYVGQYEFQMQQAQNAQTGRIGTAPAPFQGTNTSAA